MSDGLGFWGTVALVAVFNNPLWTDEAGAKRTLEDAGFTPVKVGGYDWFNGGLEGYRTKFLAVNPKGKTVEGTVHQGVIFTGSTLIFKP